MSLRELAQSKISFDNELDKLLVRADTELSDDTVTVDTVVVDATEAADKIVFDATVTPDAVTFDSTVISDKVVFDGRMKEDSIPASSRSKSRSTSCGETATMEGNLVQRNYTTENTMDVLRKNLSGNEPIETEIQQILEEVGRIHDETNETACDIQYREQATENVPPLALLEDLENWSE